MWRIPLEGKGLRKCAWFTDSRAANPRSSPFIP